MKKENYCKPEKWGNPKMDWVDLERRLNKTCRYCEQRRSLWEKL